MATLAAPSGSTVVGLTGGTGNSRTAVGKTESSGSVPDLPDPVDPPPGPGANAMGWGDDTMQWGDDLMGWGDDE